jgi:chromatin remodeling complex protein RSC6
MPSSKKSTTPKSAKSTSSKKTVAAVPASEPVVVAPVVVAPPVELTESTETVEDVPLDQQFKDILTRIQEFRTLATSLTADVRKLQKNVAREVRESNKKNRKRRVRTGDDKRPPSGFAKPALISDSLCQFLGKPSGTEMARTEVTKYLTQYIKAHALQDAENKRRINCDSALKSLLNVNDGDEVTYFNLQRYMKPHFPTSAANLAAAAAALAAAAN